MRLNVHISVPVYLVFTLSAAWVSSQTIRKCEFVDNCSCKFADDGSVIDITSLGSTDGTPRFSDVESEDGYLYSYNPCHPFNEGVCQNAAVCKKDRISGQTLGIGSADMPQFTYDQDTGDTVVGYTAGALGDYHTFVYLMCDNSAKPGPPQFFPNGTIDIPNIFFLTLFTACACGNRCDANGLTEDSSGVAIGTWLLVGVFSVFVLYWVLGVSYMKFVKKASGKEMIPNRTFWTGIPGSIKAGVMFLARGCKRDRNFDSM